VTAARPDSRPAPRVLVAGHDSATLNGIRIALEDAGIVVCGRVANAAELIDAILEVVTR
jgi:hypothetical protein